MTAEKNEKKTRKPLQTSCEPLQVCKNVGC